MITDTFELYSEAEWDHIRNRFHDSALKDTEIAILGQNAGISWPFKGSDETPAKYIQYDLEELASVPGLIGKKKRVHNLIDILRETLAFDDPFSDLVDYVESDGELDETFERIFGRFNIPSNYPARFIHFSPETRELIAAEGLATLIDVVHYGQNLQPGFSDGGDIKMFLNGIAHEDAPSIKKHLPYRTGERGLYLAEAIGLVADDLELPVRLELLGQSGYTLSAEEEAQRTEVSPETVEAALTGAVKVVADLCSWFTTEAGELRQVYASGGSPERYFIAINDARHERIAVTLARVHFGIPEVTESRGLLKKISGLFGR